MVIQFNPPIIILVLFANQISIYHWTFVTNEYKELIPSPWGKRTMIPGPVACSIYSYYDFVFPLNFGLNLSRPGVILTHLITELPLGCSKDVFSLAIGLFKIIILALKS